MITNFIKNGLSLDSLNLISKQNVPPKSLPAAQQNKIVDQVLNNLLQILKQRIGQQITQQQFKSATTSLKQTKSLQISLIQTKQKYNQLVNKSTLIYQNARKISNSFGQFVSSLNLFLQSQELIIPLGQIQKGISQIQPERVEKQMSYLIKIFESQLQQIIKRKSVNAQIQLKQQIKKLTNSNKNLQNQLTNIKNTKNNNQSKYLQQTMKVSAAIDKATKAISQKSQIQLQFKQSENKIQQKNKQIIQLKNQIEKYKRKQQQYLQKLKKTDLKILKLEKTLRQNTQMQKNMNHFIQRQKQQENQIIQQLKTQWKKKQMQFQSIRKKITLQKTIAEEKIIQMKQKIQSIQSSIVKKDKIIYNLQAKVKKYEDNGYLQIQINQPIIVSKKQEPILNQSNQTISNLQSLQQLQNLQQKPKKVKRSLQEIIKNTQILEKTNIQLKKTLEETNNNSVNKQVIKALFLSYDDESKEWSARRNIKNQIYTILNLHDKIQKPQEKQSKWFGIF